MTQEELKELFNLVHETLGHVPYAICGLGALIDHGLARRQATRISIICPRESKDIVKAWASTRGHETNADSIALSLRNGSLRRVRIKYLDHGFEGLQRVPSSFSNAIVLSVSSQLDNVAAGFLVNRARGDESALRTIAKDIFYCLDFIASRRIRVDPRFMPTFLGEDFFADFTGRYLEARPEMARAGIDVSTVLKKHRTASTLREHNEMLGQYGMRGDVVPQQPGQFEQIRDLNNSLSVYTLGDRFSNEDSVAIPPEQAPKPDQVYTDSNYSSLGPNRRPDQPLQKSNSDNKAPTTTSGSSDIGRNLTKPRRQNKLRKAERPVADWI
ncbi:hypothetical protein ONZ43_g6869 [Nemania bipapillata]|uniref:Uncharacterized protein n=1 Tax=Nemania bipapillata TaxID=110536 RepID=A0ACC2HVB5_9PEZI|nr:hypothetical protein ONZ43_g6869 [Nemania bipapillata]